jgi:hypothetical protein
VSAFLAEMAEADARSWPDDQRYQCRCAHCGGLFFGPKRAPLCWPHWQERGELQAEHQRRMIAEYGPFVEAPMWMFR